MEEPLHFAPPWIRNYSNSLCEIPLLLAHPTAHGEALGASVTSLPWRLEGAASPLALLP